MNIPDSIFTGYHGKCHIQGIAVDAEKGFIYYSFTTKLIKSTLSGEIVGSVDGLTGHLGCITFNKEDGRVYGSLEYKNDSVGRGILKNLGEEKQRADAFYAVAFDVDRIDRPDMDAFSDGIMTAVYLRDVVDDYNGTGENGAPHRYGCSGIDGTACGPLPGETDGKNRLFIAYGIYGDTERTDNDEQVILCYDFDELKKYERPLSENDMHQSGPEKPLHRFFVYTGNTKYGIQNLEYDAFTNTYLAAVYRGAKKQFPNYDLFAIDAAVPPVRCVTADFPDGCERLTLSALGELDEATGLRGFYFPYGSTGLYSFGNGTYYISEPQSDEKGQCSYIKKYVFG